MKSSHPTKVKKASLLIAQLGQSCSLPLKFGSFTSPLQSARDEAGIAVAIGSIDRMLRLPCLLLGKLANRWDYFFITRAKGLQVQSSDHSLFVHIWIPNNPTKSADINCESWSLKTSKARRLFGLAKASLLICKSEHKTRLNALGGIRLMKTLICRSQRFSTAQGL